MLLVDSNIEWLIMVKGTIFDIKEFTVHDGPGIRITVFLKGCHLRCNWCHNPEGLSFEPELMVRESACTHCGQCRNPCSHNMCRDFNRCIYACPSGLIKVIGEKVEADELAVRLKKYSEFLLMNKGGITISGGEPLAQPAFLLDLLKKLKPMHTALETSGYGEKRVFAEAINLADLILFDIKHMDADVHKKYTGVDNKLIQFNLLNLMSSGKPFIARIPLIPGVNDTDDNLEKTARFLRRAAGRIRVELLPYNPFAGAKYPSVCRKYVPSFDVNSTVRPNCEIFREYGIDYFVL